MLSTYRRIIGAVKDKTSISLAKFSGNVAPPDLQVLVVKATSHDDDLCDEKYTMEIINLTSQSKVYLNAFVSAISKRLSKTHDWIVAVKSLILVHRMLKEGDPFLGQEILNGSRKKGTRTIRVLDMSDFYNVNHSNCWDHSDFVRAYAKYLDQKLEFIVYRMKLTGGYDGKGFFPAREMNSEMIHEKLNHLLKLLDMLLPCRPTGLAKSNIMILSALYLVLMESFSLYYHLCEVLEVLLDRFPKMCYDDSAIAFDAFVKSAKTMDKLRLLYSFSKDLGIIGSSDFPQVKKLTDNLFETLKGFLKHNTTNIPQNTQNEPLHEFMALSEDLVSLRVSWASYHSNKVELALFSKTVMNRDGSWEAFNSQVDQVITSEMGKDDWELALVDQSTSSLLNKKPEMGGGLDSLLSKTVMNRDGSWETFNSQVDQVITSEIGKDDWELALVDQSTSNLLNKKPEMGGGLDSLLLNGMHEDPFQASPSVPPPAYDQIADMEMKQHFPARNSNNMA
ncbi:probable clathrin assembly protein At4g32285 [Impatiens glandulifera]|uniref:probable clathrin assembly protein At4g32285 n=1 Tax=Impatiens glandulifera TaxID=253017 RepID=UPI001FB0DE54|nr:probable clathrin assembly protein At4g32285 [Impatiens glandulifera]